MIFVAISSLLLASPLFAVDANPTVLQHFAVEGLSHHASGTVYPGGALEDGGLPLGGLGTGYLCVDTDGRFGKTSIFNRYPVPVFLGTPFLTVSYGGKEYVVAVNKDDIGDAKAVHYFGHYPVLDARFVFEAPFQVELRAYAPFIPGDTVETNTPAVVFEVAVANGAASEQSVTVTFSPNGFPDGSAATFSADDEWTGVQTTHAPLEGMVGWVKGTYAVAAEKGRVAGNAVSVECAIPANGNGTARFVLAWHNPYLRDGSGRVEMHQYAKRFADAKAVAEHAVAKHAEWLRRILSWQDAVYGAEFPDWLKEALINAPYVHAKNSLWLASTRPDDWWGEEGLFLVNESFSTCSLTETMPCRFFGHWPMLFFFPDLELSTLKAIRAFQLRGGEPPFCFGMGFSVRDPRYHCQHTCGAGEYAQMIHRYWLRTGDDAFLADFYDSAKASLNFMMWLDKDGDGLVEDQPHALKDENFPGNNPLDQWPWHGASAYTAGKGMAALISGIAMAEKMGDSEQAAAWRGLLEKGRKSYEEKLWTGQYYRTYNQPETGLRNDSCFAAQLSGIWSTRVLGLEDALPKDRIATALDSVARLNLPASPFGMVDAVNSDGTWCVEGGGSGIPDTCWSRDIFIQCNATAAMVYLYEGRTEEGASAAKAMLDTLFRGPHAMPWAQPCGVCSKTGGTCHGHDYYDHAVVWSYPLAFAGQDIAQACAAGGFIRSVLDAAVAR